MDDEVYSFALKNALNEIRNACPNVKNSFMFKEDGAIIGGDKDTSEESIKRVVGAFEGILEKGETIGGVEGMTVEGDKGRVNISCFNDLYLVTVTSRKADMKYVNTIARVLIPTVLKLLEKIHPASLKNIQPREIMPEKPVFNEVEDPAEADEEEFVEEPEEIDEPESIPSEPPVNQLIVEDLGGLLVPSDTVRIDNETISEWEETYEGERILEVEIETFDGKSVQCKVKPLKDSKYSGKGIIRMPEKIQDTLDIKKGELVRVRPVVQ